MIEIWPGVDHAEDTQPRIHTVKVTHGSLEAAQYRERGKLRRIVRLLQRYLFANLAKWLCKRSVRIEGLRAM